MSSKLLPMCCLGCLQVLVLSFLLACGQSARDKTIHAAYDTTTAARAGFVAYDLTHQTELVKTSPDLAAQRAAVDAWRAKRATIIEAFEAVYRALAAAILVNDDQSMPTLLKAVQILGDELHALGVGGVP